MWGWRVTTSAPPPPRFAPPVAGGPFAGRTQLPLSFFAGAFFWLFVAATGLAWHAPALATHYSHLALTSLAHAWLPGFLLSAAFGAVYQLMPIAMGSVVPNERLGWVHFALHTVGMLLLVPSFILARFEGVAAGGVLVAAGVLLLAVNLLSVFRRAVHRDVVGWSFVLATAWLVVTVLVGVLIAANRRWAFLPLDVLALLRSHAHLGVVGFFLTLLQGATFQLIPMFTLSGVQNWKRVRVGLWGTQIGLALLAPALAWNWRLGVIAGAGLLALGVGVSAYELTVILRGRRRRILDPGLQAFAAGAVMIGVATVVGLGLAIWPAGGDWAGRLALAYGVAVIVGGLMPIIGGMLCKIVPFLVWMKVYGALVGRAQVPPPAGLARPGLERGWLLAQSGAVGLLLVGILAQHETWLKAGSWTLVAGTCLFLFNQGWVLSHLWKKKTTALPVAQRTAA